MALTKNCHYDFRAYAPVGGIDATNGVPVNTDNTTNFFLCGQHSLQTLNIAQNTDIGFTRNANGWVIPNDNTDDEGIEIAPGVVSNANMPYCFTVGTEPAFFCRAVFTIPDVSDYDVAFCGFRLAGAFAASGTFDEAADVITAYNSVNGINVNLGAIYTATRLAAGVGTLTDTTQTMTDGQFIAIENRVSAAGVTSCLVGVGASAALAQAALAAPTVNTNTITHAAAVILVPTLVFAKGANASDTPPIITTWTYGLV